MASFVLRVAGEVPTANDPKCGDPTCAWCAGARAAEVVVHDEPVSLARRLAAPGGGREASAPRADAVERPRPGVVAPSGRLYRRDEIARVVAELDAALGDDAPATDAAHEELRRARAVFGAALRHHRAVVLED
jgi:hypothetical protein